MKVNLFVNLLCFIFFSSSLMAYTTQCSSSWSSGHHISQNNSLNDAIWVEEFNHFIAVGTGVFISPDGKNWKSLSLNIDKKFNKVFWNGQQLIAIGDNGLIITSSDMLNWQSQNSTITTSLNSIDWNGQYYLVTGPYGTLLKSQDGKSWQLISMDETYNFMDVKWTGERWLIAGYHSSGFVLNSTNAETWQEVDFFGLPEHLYKFKGDYYVFMSDILCRSPSCIPTVYKSTNGLSWEKVERPLSRYSDIYKFGEQWIGLTPRVIPHVSTSTDGFNWNYQYLPRDRTHIDYHTITGNDQLLLLLGSNNIILTSKDAVHWEDSQLHQPQDLIDVIAHKNQYIAVGAKGTILHSSDGQQWLLQYTDPNINLNSIAANDNIFVAVGGRDLYDSFIEENGDFSIDNKRLGRGAIVTSQDGLTWSKVRIPDTRAELGDVIWNGQLFVVAGKSGVMMTSEDGQNWTITQSLISSSRNSTTSPLTLPKLIFSGQKILAMASYFDGNFFSSVDGYKWINNKTEHGELKMVAWNGDFFLARGADGKIYRSQDGMTWSDLNIEYINKVIQTIDWDGKEFLAVVSQFGGGGSAIYSSKTGEKWEQKILSEKAVFLKAISGPNGLVAVGKSGVIYNEACNVCDNTEAVYNESNKSLTVPIVSEYDKSGQLITYNNVELTLNLDSDSLTFDVKSIESHDNNSSCLTQSSVIDLTGSINIPTVKVKTSDNFLQTYNNVKFQMTEVNEKKSIEFQKVGD